MSEFNMEMFTKKVQETAIATMGQLFPQEQLEKLVADAVERFFEPTEIFQSGTRLQGDRHAWGDQIATTGVKASTFEVLVWQALVPKVQQALSKALQEKEAELDQAAANAVHSPDIEKLTAEGVTKHAHMMSVVMSGMYLTEAIRRMRTEVQGTLVNNGITQGALFHR